MSFNVFNMSEAATNPFNFRIRPIKITILYRFPVVSAGFFVCFSWRGYSSPANMHSFLCHYLVFSSDSSILLASANKLSLPQEHAAKVMIFFNIVSNLLTSNRQMTFFHSLPVGR